MFTRQRLITILTLFGLGVSGYLTYTHLFGVPIYCGGASSCELVNSSRYAFLGPIPVSLLGLIGYLAILVLSFIPTNDDRQWPAQLIFGVALIGAMFQLYLTYIELFVLHAICYWCVASQILILLIFILALPRSMQEAEEDDAETIDSSS
jgi:uncharacterized membrane protein